MIGDDAGEDPGPTGAYLVLYGVILLMIALALSDCKGRCEEGQRLTTIIEPIIKVEAGEYSGDTDDK